MTNTTSAASVGITRHAGQHLSADPARVVTQLFVPGQEGFDHHESRSSAVLRRILALPDDEVALAFEDLVARFGDRHRDLIGTFERHAGELADRLEPGTKLSQTRRLLLGATFTSEYAVEGAALCNPSVVADPDQSGVPTGSLRFVMSVRGIGEGHRSSVGFRTGIVTAAGEVSIIPPGPFVTAGQTEPALFDTRVFRRELERLGNVRENVDYVFDTLGDQFSAAELEERLGRLEGQLTTRKQGRRIIPLIRTIAERTYAVRFPDATALAERVLLPAMAAESRGIEDARFVRFIEDDGSVSYLATYTAYNGAAISQQLLTTGDFRNFVSSPIVGLAAGNKGLALFPRRIGGRFAAMCRSDRESNAVAFTANLHSWESSSPCQVPARAWEVIQLGNCGPPIETEAGWLVLTHGVGPMRTYSIGAMLLDLEDPTRVIGKLERPLLRPTVDERDGYVPNVIYSCGSLVHAETLVLPYGIGDRSIGFATMPMNELLGALDPSTP